MKGRNHDIQIASLGRFDSNFLRDPDYDHSIDAQFLWQKQSSFDQQIVLMVWYKKTRADNWFREMV